MSERTYYFITGLPRSRTAWFANYLTWDNSFCFHDGFFGLDSVSDIQRKFDSVSTRFVGNSDPCNLLFYTQLSQMYPKAKWVIVRRDYEESLHAARRAFGPVHENSYRHLQAQMEVVCRHSDPLVIDFATASEQALEVANYLGIDTGGIARLNLLRNMQVQIEPNVLRSHITAMQEAA